jgi:hypothetical protein
VFISVVEPLKEELNEFAKCITENRQPKQNGKSAVRVLRMLDDIRKGVLDARN